MLKMIEELIKNDKKNVTDFSWAFFGNTLFNLFAKSTNQLIYYFSGNLDDFDASNTFAFLDKTVGVVITRKIQEM